MLIELAMLNIGTMVFTWYYRYFYTFYSYEANVQMHRDKMVEEQLVDLLQQRAADCMWYEAYNKEIENPKSKCGELKVCYSAYV